MLCPFAFSPVCLSPAPRPRLFSLGPLSSQVFCMLRLFLSLVVGRGSRRFREKQVWIHRLQKAFPSSPLHPLSRSTHYGTHSDNSKHRYLLSPCICQVLYAFCELTRPISGELIFSTNFVLWVRKWKHRFFS